jgi:hypothetical protein
MCRLSKEIVTIIIDEYGLDEFLRRVSDPLWFQALGCVLGYDWHSSGVTTVITAVLKQVLIPEEHGVAVCGGKGRVSRSAPAEIGIVGEKFGFGCDSVKALQYASRMSAKVDNTAIQAGYQLYHHAFFVTENKKWAVVQQGMCPQDRTARRYHWLSDSVKSFVSEPHDAIVGEVRREAVLDMTAKESEGSRKASVDIVRESPKRLKRMFMYVKAESQTPLSQWLPAPVRDAVNYTVTPVLSMPRNVNWKKLEEVYEFRPSSYEELLAIKGVGPATVRGLALIADLIYGEKPSWKDPVKYSFAYGGKDGVPFPVDRKAMDESIHVLRQAVDEARIGEMEKIRALQSLTKFVPET